ncbi:MAG TPA: AMIN domain-containing protein, partial [Thermoanaerobaculia bacterium]
MKTGKRILLVTAVMLLAADGVQAGFWKSRKSQAAADTKPTAAAPMALTAVELGSSRVTLRTTGTPAYTSYSPAPDVFVVDLTGTERPADLAIPAELPAGVGSIAAEQVVEMGNRLTRVTFRFTTPFSPEVSAADKAVLVLLPEVAVAAAETQPVEEPAATVTVVDEEPKQEEIPAQPVIAAAPTVQLPKAKQVKTIAAEGAGDDVRIRIAGDGEFQYNAFRLDNPARLVVDLQGVRNVVKKPAVEVNSGAVERVRVGQFKAGAAPIARVVIDLSS